MENLNTRNPNNPHQSTTPINDTEIPQSSQICNGNDCTLSINGNFYCPSCSYNNAIAQLEKTQKDLIFAKRNLISARKNVFLFLNSPSVGSSEVVNVEGCCGKGVNLENCAENVEICQVNQPELTTADEFVVEKLRDCEGDSDVEHEEESVSCQDKDVRNGNVDEKYGAEGEGSESMDDLLESLVAEDSDDRTVTENQPEVTTADEFVVEKSRVCERNCGGEGSNLVLEEESVKNVEEQYGLNGDESERNGDGEGSKLGPEESVSCQRKENADVNYGVEGDESESMDDSQESSIFHDSDDSVDGFDEDLDLLSRMFGQRASQVIDKDTEEFGRVRENEKDSELGVEFRSENSKSDHKSAEKRDRFTDFRDDTPVVKNKKLARRVTFSPVITVFPFEASQSDNEAMPCESASNSDVNFRSESSNLQSLCADKGDLFAEFRYDKSTVQSRNVASPELSMIKEETARYYNGAKRYKLAKRSTNPAIPDSRRKRLHWTHEEEEKLVDCVRIFLNRGSRKLSWKSILEYGSQVFHRSRTPEDLRFKWKNLVKEASRGKRR
ncbi:hypothetical protein ACHQM5_015837 [Ranunculus cassubicifolius]